MELNTDQCTKERVQFHSISNLYDSYEIRMSQDRHNGYPKVDQDNIEVELYVNLFDSHDN